MARKIRSGDLVQVIAGSGRNGHLSGKVLRVITSKDRVIVEGVNRVWKHVRPSQRYPQGGRIQKEAPIHVSNVKLVDPSSGKAVRVKFEMRDGVKHRVANGSKTDLGAVGRKTA